MHVHCKLMMLHVKTEKKRNMMKFNVFLQAHMQRVMRAHGAPAPLHAVMPDRCAWHLLERASLTATRALTWGFFPPLDEAFVVAGGQVSLRDICEVDATVIHEEIFLQLRIRIFLGQIDDLNVLGQWRTWTDAIDVQRCCVASLNDGVDASSLVFWLQDATPC